MTETAASARRLALGAFRRAPRFLRRAAVRLVSPHYVLGAVCVLRHRDHVLLVRQRHDVEDGWSLPGGLLRRGELPAAGLARELAEELDLVVRLGEQPTLTLVVPHRKRVDLVFEVRVEHRPEVTVDGLEVVRAEWRPVADSGATLATAEILRLLS